MPQRTCSIDGCDKPQHSRTMCGTHYAAWRVSFKGAPLPPVVKPPRARRPPCSIAGCDTESSSRGWCATHYTRWLKHGDPQPPNIRRVIHHGASDDERLRHHGWTPIDRVPGLGPCWEWNGNRHVKDGYGRLGVNGQVIAAHIFAYRTWVGPIPSGHLIRHRCDNPPCINPHHLLTGTPRDNMDDKIERGRSGYRLPNAKRPEVIAAWLAGASCADLAVQYGVGPLLISRLVRPAREELRRALVARGGSAAVRDPRIPHPAQRPAVSDPPRRSEP